MRTESGTMPLAGRAHTSLRNVWFLGGMGARGLLYHALLARWLVDAACAGEAARLPLELRRGEFAPVVGRQLERLAAARAKDAEAAREAVRRAMQTQRIRDWQSLPAPEPVLRRAATAPAGASRASSSKTMMINRGGPPLPPRAPPPRT